MLRKRLFKNKKGNIIISLLLAVVSLFIFGVVSIFGVLIFDDVNTDIQNDNEIAQEAKDNSQDLYNQYPNLMDGLWISAFTFIWILMLVVTYFRSDHPLMFVIIIIFMGAIIYVGATLSNKYYEISEENELSEYNNKFPMTKWIMDMLPIVIFLILISIFLVILIT